MVLDHERLDVYAIALGFLVFANEVIERLPRGRGHLADQLTRASTSIVLNLAEGAGKLSKADKRRYYLTARGSATESAALLDVCLRLKLLGEAEHRAGKAMIVRVVSMLIKLAMSFEDARPGTAPDAADAAERSGAADAAERSGAADAADAAERSGV
jgi:four helix bundle protein